MINPFDRDGSTTEKLQLGAVSFVTLFSSHALIGLTIHGISREALITLGATPVIALIVKGRARKWFVFYMLFNLAGGMGLIYGLIFSIFPGQVSLRPTPGSIVAYLVYVLMAILCYRRAEALERKNA